ncbi:DUF4476 domain-containing protein [Parafilimonas sp.]|uniref:DUF4476 domain-containing protein n=1 Tax=Parafilimonas sp. TaxID=1969739 RepID=UPI0039E218F1
MKYSLKISGFLFFFCMICFAAKTQQKHFIYVQSEDRQPFAIVMNGKVFSSSDYGYIIIPKLDDGEYKFTVSFPLNKFPDQSFTCAVNKKDAGYYLKNGSNGWALENMQTQQSIASGTAHAGSDNAFGNMLSDVVSDSTLTKPIAATPAPATEKPVVDAASTTETTPAVVPATTGTASAQPEKIGELKADTGTNMLFVDNSQPGSDTISVFIPTEPKGTERAGEVTAANDTGNAATQDSFATAASQDTSPAETKQEAKAGEPVFLDTDKPSAKGSEKTTADVSNPFYNAETNKAATTPVETHTEATPSENNATTHNTAATRQGCDNMLSDEDLNKLKRKMFSQDNDDAMVKYAVKSVSKKCISTDQVKALGSLLSSDDGRYNLYDSLYKYVYDYGNYATLETQILDPYYKKRFAAMLH